MKKFILPLFILTTLPAFAVKINPDTQIQWNAIVVVAALHDVGLNGDSLNFHPDVALTYNRILNDLLSRKTFSAADAVSVCVQQCDKSSFLKEGRGESGKKCPDICKDFGMALATENNKGIKSIKLDEGYYDGYHPLGRVYTSDNKFYSLSVEEKTGGCNDAIFESSTDKKIAVCTDGFGEGGVSETHFKITDPKYNGFDFMLGCKYCITCPGGDEGVCRLEYVDTANRIQELQQQYEKCVSIYKSADLTTIRTLSENPLIYGYDLKKISDNAEKIFALKNKFYGTKPDGYFDDWYLVGPLSDYCNDISLASINAKIEKAKSDIKCAKDNFKTTSTFKDTETKTLEEAREKIVRYLDYTCRGVKWSAIKCSGDCNGPGKQDYVACTLGDLKATFEFDDICDKTPISDAIDWIDDKMMSIGF